MAGSLIGAALLVILPEKSFELIVPVLIVLALVMVVIQPRLQKYLKARQSNAVTHSTIAVYCVLFFTAIYGGYFAAAQGIILIGLLGIVLDEPLQTINGYKNVLVLFVNLVSATAYTVIGFNKISWMAVLLIAAGSLVGGYVGARIGRKLNPTVLRAVIVILGMVAFVRILGIHA